METWIIALRDCYALETGKEEPKISENVVKSPIISTHSVRSMISNPFEHKIAIFAFRKIKSYDSEGRKKSCEGGINRIV